MRATVTFDSITVPRGTAVGTVLQFKGEGGIKQPSGPAIYTCDNAWQYQSIIGIFPTLSSYGNGVYNTNIPGIGIKIFRGTNDYIPSVSSIGVGGTLSSQYYNYYLIKTSTGNVGSGTLTTGNLFKYYSSTSGVTFAEVNLTGTTKITSTLCSINTTNVSVPLDDVAINELPAIGSTAKSKVFNVGLDCDANAKISVKLTGAQDPDASADGVLKLTGAGSANVASGVGIQILYNNAPMVFNNTMALKTSTGGLETFPFTAQYYQTKSTVSAGTANATATLEVSYQ